MLEVYDENRFDRASVWTVGCIRKDRPTWPGWRHGMGARVEITEALYVKRVWNELAKFTADWDEAKILDEAKKHMAELRNEFVA